MKVVVQKVLNASVVVNKEEVGYEGEYIGVGSCILGYPANGFPEPIERKADYYKIIR